MNRMLAIIERELRKFFRSPALMMVSMIFPLVQLIILGNAFGGKIVDAKMGIVDEDGGTQALRIREAFDSVRVNVRTFVPIVYSNEKQAMEDVRNGKIDGAVIIPPQYSSRVYEQNHPQIALIVDNSDNFMSSTLEEKLTELTQALNQPVHEISAARFDRVGDVCVRHDRRRHAVYRRQSARCARRLSGDAHHEN
jgi:ABC-2 type transport system permease protein